MVLMVLSLYWGMEVVRNTLHVVVAGTVGTWWAVPHSGDPTWGSIKRAFTTSFGSICFGSLIIAIVQTLRWMAETAKRSAERRGNAAAACAAACAACLIRMLEDAMKYFTSYAFCQVALYGKGFWEAGKDTFAMFTRRGWTAIFNDHLIDRALALGMLLFGAIGGVVGASLTYVLIPDAKGDEQHAIAIVAGVFSFLVGVVMCAIISGIIESAVKTVFVCFAERPEALLYTHPAEFEEIIRAWRAFQPEFITSAGYDTTFSRGGAGASA